MRHNKSKWVFALQLLFVSSFVLAQQPVGPRLVGPLMGGGGGGAGAVTTAALKNATYCESATGTDAYACTLTTAPADLAAMKGVVVSFRADVANTGAATVAFNGFAATPIVKIGLTVTTALITGDIRAGDIVTVRYDGTSFACLSCDGLRASTGISQTFTVAQTMNNNIDLILAGTTIGTLRHATSMTPDVPALLVGTTANAWHIYEFGDAASDLNNGACGTSACTDPGLVIHSAVADTTQYNHLAAWGRAGGALKTLTESVATSVIQIPIANLAGAFGKFCYTVKAADATDSQIRGSCIKYTVTAKAGTETCSLNTEAALTSDASITETEDGSGSGAITTGTLTYAITCSTTPSNAVDIQINAVSSLAQTTLNVTYNVNHVGPGQPARQ